MFLYRYRYRYRYRYPPFFVPYTGCVAETPTKHRRVAILSLCIYVYLDIDIDIDIDTCMYIYRYRYRCVYIDMDIDIDIDILLSLYPTQVLLQKHKLNIVESQYYLAPIGAASLLATASVSELPRAHIHMYLYTCLPFS